MTEPSPFVITLPREAAENSPIHRGRAHPILHNSRAGRHQPLITMTALERTLLWILVCYEGLKLLWKGIYFLVLL